MLVASLVISILIPGCTPSVDSRPPDVLLITVDTLRPDFLGVYGSKAGASPKLDSLARESVVFERAIAASARTVPSHATIMTSLWVRDHSVGWINGSSRLDGEVTVAEVFSEAGYDTAAFVGNMMLRVVVGLDAGFDVYDDELDDFEVNRPRFRERHADHTTQRVLRWLSQDRDRPWFLWVHYQDPHGPYTPPAVHADAVDLEIEGEEPLPLLEGNRGEHGVPAYQARPGSQTPSAYADRYAGEIHFFDTWLGTLLEAVDRDARETVILLTADHGESFGEEGWWFSHGFRTTPDQVHVPFILRAPGFDPARRKDLVHHVDIAPTLIALAGLEAPGSIRGVDLSPWIREETALPPRTIYADLGFEVSAYRGLSFLRAELSDSSPPPTHFQWISNDRWSPTGPDEPTLLSDLNDYVSRKPDMARVDRRSRASQQERMRQLRALGYLEAGEEEEMPDVR